MYIGLFSILMGGTVVAAYQLMGSGTRTQNAVQTQEEGTFLNRKINWALTGASAVSASGATLTVTRPDLGAQSPLVISGGSGVMTLMRGGSSATTLNNTSLQVTNISFTVTPAAYGRPTEVDSSFSVGTMPFTFKTYLRQ